MAADSDEAERMIRAGEIILRSGRASSPGFLIDEEAVIEQKTRMGLRGMEKLRGPYQEWRINAMGKVCADIGASTGGFTSLLLEDGAEKVYAIDVGHGQLDSKLRNDARVVVMERVNARYLEELPEPIDLFVIDVSFISLDKILPAVRKIIDAQGREAEVVALVKPQFELGKAVADRYKGVIKDPELQRQALERIKQVGTDLGFRVLAELPSPLQGPKGNQEWFVRMKS
jgi:23S rRNA (cytidine1920-2'-O)/16S rRNA (cytidine1409-2'-O)-methyltransferase